MDDYSKIFETTNPSIPETGTDIDYSSITTEYNGVPDNTENERISGDIREFDTMYTAPKTVVVRRYKLKKM